jgi:hypothetical protein
VTASGDEIRLEPGVLVLGRSSSADLLLEDPQVSRQHARLLVSNVGVLVEDLGSTNGVFVNESRIWAPTALGDGDRLLIGSFELTVRAGHRLETPTPRPVPVRAERTQPSEPPPSASPTERADAFDTLGRLAERMLTLGKTDVALRLVSGHLRTLLHAAREGQPIPAKMRDAASHVALRLACATGDARHADIAIELALLAKRPLSEDAITELERILPAVDPGLFDYYLVALTSVRLELAADERDRADRIVALGADPRLC